MLRLFKFMCGSLHRTVNGLIVLSILDGNWHGLSFESWQLFSLNELDGIWDQEFANLVDSGAFNSLGYFIESETINYQIDGNPVGSKWSANAPSKTHIGPSSDRIRCER